LKGPPNGHKLIGYWAGYGSATSTFPLRDVSPQWDVIIVAFATPDRDAQDGSLRFSPPRGLEPEEFKSDNAYLKSQGKKVMISLGGGGQHFTLPDSKQVPNFVAASRQILRQFGVTARKK
jgi:chitinase